MNHTEKFVKLVQEHPDLPVIPMVDSEIVADDSYGRWTASFGWSEVDWYYVGDERFHVKSEADDEDVMNDLSCEDKKRLIPANCDDVYDLSDEEWEHIVGQLEWKQAIIVNINTPDYL